MKSTKKPLPFKCVKIKTRLIELNMTQRELANKVGVNENYLTDILNGRRSGKKYMDSINKELNIEDDLSSMRGVV